MIIRQPTQREKIFANIICNKGWCPKHIELIRLNPKKQIIQVKNRQKTWTDISPKKKYRWPTVPWKDVHHHPSSGKCKSKGQWYITSPLSEWLTSTAQETTGIGRMWIKGNPHELWVGMQTVVATVENSMKVPQKIKYRTTLRSSNHTTGYLPKEYENGNSKRYVHPSVSCTIYNITIWKQPKCLLKNW